MNVRLIASLAACCVSQQLWAQRVGVPTDELTSLTADELFRIPVTSVGRKAQQMSKAPAAVFVLTSEDIRRSGATSIPEALQWVPGLNVLRVDGRAWAVSARGSARLYADKILVMIDGRSLYTPLFSGVIWDSIDVPLSQVEQIEIVRGPGAVMWGPNAVNGVINIITRQARSTTGGEVVAATGNDLRGSLQATWGKAPSERLAYRMWGKFDDRNPAFSSPGYYFFDTNYPLRDERPVEDLDAKTGRLGFRVDAQYSERDELVVQGDVYRTGRREELGFPVLLPGILERTSGRTTDQGGFFQGRWTRTTSQNSDSRLQFALSRQDVSYPFVSANLNNLAVDFQNRRQTGELNEIYWGAGYQQYWDQTASNRFVSFSPAADVLRLANVVFRDEFQVLPNRLLVSAGVRLDYSSYARLDWQPSVRVLYTPDSRQSAWFAVSRAIRLPSRFDRDLRISSGARLNDAVTLEPLIFGSRDTVSENVRSFESGYRLQSRQRWSIDSSVFWNQYGKLRNLSRSTSPNISFNGSVPKLSISLLEQNRGKGQSFGTETWLTYHIKQGWRLTPSYSYLNETQTLPAPTPQEVYAWMFRSGGSRHQAILRSQHDLARQWRFDLTARARSRDLGYNLPGVMLVDARLAFHATPESEFSVSVRNVTNRISLEGYSESPFATIPTRRIFVVRWVQRF